MRTWEYQVVTFRDASMHARNLNELGAQGWEMVQYLQPSPREIHERAIFKRPTNEPDAPPPRRVF